MTAQIDDSFRYRKRQYSVAGISEGELFDPAMLDLKPVGISSNCWRGYRAIFGLFESRLVLDSLHVNLTRDIEGATRYERVKGPVINGVEPTAPKRQSFFNNCYVGLQYHLEYSGGLLLAGGFIESLYVHMGFHPAWKYKTVLELIFEAGVLQAEFDRSKCMAEVRAAISNSRADGPSDDLLSLDGIQQFVERAFDRRY